MNIVLRFSIKFFLKDFMNFSLRNYNCYNTSTLRQLEILNFTLQNTLIFGKISEPINYVLGL